MKCGFYETNVTPALNSIIPGGFAARYANEILDPLFARAFVAVSEERSLGIVSIDACGITLDITERIRERVAEFTPLQPEDVMVMATHAHGGGPTLNWGEQVVTDAHYLTELVNKAADAVIIAYQNAAESTLTLGRGELYGISFVRVYRMKDGTYKTNPSRKAPELIDAPHTDIDPELIVMGVKQEEKWVGAVVSFANHPATVATRQITGDYISILAKEMKGYFGSEFVTVFINGACGDINHVNPFDPETVEPDRYRVVGKTLAEKTREVMESASPMSCETLATAKKNIIARFRKPSPEALQAAKEVFEGLGDGLIESIPRTPGYQKTFYALQAFRIMADKRTVRDLELQLFRIGDVYVAGTPTQIFNRFGKRIKAGLPGACMVSAFANDYCGYVPEARFIGEPGVYEARLCPTSALAGETGDLVVEGILSLEKELR
ncbi:MAG: neutral/alkaline non-lysosomal ceramidase N-terminal domain-containing protein [Clostridia bacterium]|nr:neutral/alkaline non-lysosomal ceramidase N-terminal domain-containing protein [Clostridia bacterium]